MNKRFYQNYVIESKEEAFVILKLYIESNYKSLKDGYMDEVICNLFTREDYFGRDKIDNSCCYLVSKDIEDVLCGWAGLDNLSAISEEEGFSSLDEDKVIHSLYSKFVGESDIYELYKKDAEIFDIRWYENDHLFKKLEGIM